MFINDKEVKAPKQISIGESLASAIKTSKSDVNTILRTPNKPIDEYH